jgi:hypothetical protein
MSLSREQYLEIAEIIRCSYALHLDTEMHPANVQGYILQGVASQLAWMFSQGDTEFNRNEFMADCFPRVGV